MATTKLCATSCSFARLSRPRPSITMTRSMVCSEGRSWYFSAKGRAREHHLHVGKGQNQWQYDSRECTCIANAWQVQWWMCACCTCDTLSCIPTPLFCLWCHLINQMIKRGSQLLGKCMYILQHLCTHTYEKANFFAAVLNDQSDF